MVSALLLCFHAEKNNLHLYHSYSKASSHSSHPYLAVKSDGADIPRQKLSVSLQDTQQSRTGKRVLRSTGINRNILLGTARLMGANLMS